jgi:hypothetical protein
MSDKAYSVEQRLNALLTLDAWNSLGGCTGFTITNARYRLAGLNQNEVEIEVEASANGTQPGNPFANTLPAAYRPLVLKNGPCAISGAASVQPGPRIEVQSGGTVSILGFLAAYTGLVACHFRYPLD